MSRANCLQIHAFYACLRRVLTRGTLALLVVFLYANVVCFAQEVLTERSKNKSAFSFHDLAFAGVENADQFRNDLEGRFRFLSYSKTEPSADVFHERVDRASSEVVDTVESLESQTPIYRGMSVSDFKIKPRCGRLFGRFNGAWGMQADQGGHVESSGFEVKSYGAGVGQDWTLTSNLIWGYGLQVNNVKISPSGKGSYEASHDVLAGYLQLGVFASLWRFDVSLGASKNWQSQRFLSTLEKSKITSSQRNYEMEFGACFDKGYTRIEPRVNFRVVSLSEPEAAESFLVSYLFMPNEFSDTSYRLKIGSRFSWEYETFLATFKPYLSADWGHEFGNQTIYTIGDSSRYPVAYRFGKHKMARDRLDLGAGIDVALHECCDVYAHYDAEFAKEYVDYLFDLGVNIKY